MSLIDKNTIRPYICGVYLCFGTSFTAQTTFQNFYDTELLEADVVSLYATSSKVSFTETKTSSRSGELYQQRISISLPIGDNLRSENIERIHQAEQVVLKLTNGEYLYIGRNDAFQNTKPKIAYNGDENTARFQFTANSISSVGYANLERLNEQFNVFIGNYGEILPDKSDFADKFEISINDIIHYRIIDNDVNCFVSSNFTIRDSEFAQDSDITFWKDYSNLGIYRYVTIFRDAINLKEVDISDYKKPLPQADILNSFVFRTPSLERLILKGIERLTHRFLLAGDNITEIDVNDAVYVDTRSINSLANVSVLNLKNCKFLGIDNHQTAVPIFDGAMNPNMTINFNEALLTSDAGSLNSYVQGLADTYPNMTINFYDDTGNYVSTL